MLTFPLLVFRIYVLFPIRRVNVDVYITGPNVICTVFKQLFIIRVTTKLAAHKTIYKECYFEDSLSAIHPSSLKTLINMVNNKISNGNVNSFHVH